MSIHELKAHDIIMHNEDGKLLIQCLLGWLQAEKGLIPLGQWLGSRKCQFLGVEQH